jgi:uncharacterized protein YbjT (DUF2867 family)
VWRRERCGPIRVSCARRGHRVSWQQHRKLDRGAVGRRSCGRATRARPRRASTADGCRAPSARSRPANWFCRGVGRSRRARAGHARRPGQVRREIALIEAAHQAGVRRIVKLSVLGADQWQPMSFFARSATVVERTLRSAPVAHVILRPGFFMQNLLRQRVLIEGGTLIDANDGRPAALIDVADIAAVAAIVAAGRHDGRALTLSGPAALTAEQIADTLATAMGRPVQVRALIPDALHAALLSQGSPRWFADAQRELATGVCQGRADFTAELTDTVADLTGHRRAPWSNSPRRTSAAADPRTVLLPRHVVPERSSRCPAPGRRQRRSRGRGDGGGWSRSERGAWSVRSGPSDFRVCRAPRGRDGPVWVRAARCLADPPSVVAARTAVLRDRWTDPGATVGGHRGSSRAASACR